MKIKTNKLAILSAAFMLSAVGVIAQEADTNATTIAYWKLSAAHGTIPLSPGGTGSLDLATNSGQGIALPGTGLAPATVQDLWFQGNLASAPTYTSQVPPASMFNANNYFNAGTSSWDCGNDELNTGGTLTCDNVTYGNAFNGPNFTWEVYFKSDTTNDPVGGTQSQFIIFDHHLSAYAFININDNANNDTNQIGSIRFWSWNVAIFGIDCRITAAQNHGHRMDDGHWHYAAARFDMATETMDLLVVNDDGTSSETSTYIQAPLNPGGPGSQGPLFVGCDEGGNSIFNGQINQLRYSDVSLPNNQLMANVTACNAPVFDSPAATNIVYVGDVLTLSPVLWPLNVQDASLQFLQYQWQLNGANLPGQTNSFISLFPASTNNVGTYQLIATNPCSGVWGTSSNIVVVVNPKPVVNIARWRMEAVAGVTNNGTPPGTFTGIMDSDTAVGQGIYSTGAANVPASEDDLITFNGAGGSVSLTNDVPPTSMFINGNNAGSNSFDASWINGVAGALFYPQDQYGDEFDFQTQFSLELFFKTYGDQSGNGTMQLIAQGPDAGTFTYGLNINQAANGAVSFKINNHAIPPNGLGYEDTNSGIQSVVLSDRNYADGTWHYLLAKFDSTANSISLSIANADGTGKSATIALPAGYSPLQGHNVANMFIGRYRYGTPDDNRTFIGAIDEVQITSGLVSPSTGQLGFLPGVVVPAITSISVSGGTVTIKFTGSATDAASAFTLMGSSTVAGTYTALPAAVITSLGGGNFQATIATSGSTEFYRIKR